MSRLSEIRDKFTELFGWEGDKLMPVDFAMSAYASTFLTAREQRPFSVLAGGASSGKTAILDTFRDSDPEKGEQERRTVMQGDMTENSFASGYRPEDDPEKDPSMLARLDFRRAPLGNKVLVCTEMGQIWGLPSDRRGRWLNQMRMAYDGQYDNNTGNVGRVYYKLGFGFVGATTAKIYDVMKVDGPLGQRIIICRMSRKMTDLLERCDDTLDGLLQSPYTQKERKESLRALVTEHMDSFVAEVLAVPQYIIEQPLHLLDQLSKLTNIGVLLRTTPISNQTMSPDPELAHRLPEQIRTLLDGRAGIDGRKSWNESDIDLARRVVQDTMPPELLWAMRIMWGNGPEDAAKGHRVEAVRYKARAGESLGRQFDQWAISGLVTELEQGSYSLTPDAIKIIAACDFFKGLDNPADAR